MAEVITLAFGTAFRLKIGELLGSFDAFCHDAQLEATAHRDNGADQYALSGSTLDILHKRLVYFQGIDGKAAQVAQAGVTGTKIVNGNLDAEVFQRQQYPGGALCILHQPALGKLKLEQARVQAGITQGSTHVCQKIAAVKFCRRNVHGDLAKVHAGLLPGQRLATGFAEHPFANRMDQAAVLCDTDKLRRVQQLPIRLLKAHQRFRTGDGSGAEMERGLVMQHQRTRIQRPAQCGLYRQARSRPRIHLGAKRLVLVAPALLGVVHGGVGMSQQHIGIVAVVGIHTDPDAQGNVQLL